MRPAATPRDPRPSIEELDHGIVSLATSINKATYDMLVLIRQFDERAGWLKWGFLSCVDWLHWRIQPPMSRNVAGSCGVGSWSRLTRLTVHL